MKQFDGIIALDAMGGDFGPAITVPAAITAIKDFGIKVILVGNPDEINAELSKFPKEISEKMKVKTVITNNKASIIDLLTYRVLDEKKIIFVSETESNRSIDYMKKYF